MNQGRSFADVFIVAPFDDLHALSVQYYVERKGASCHLLDLQSASSAATFARLGLKSGVTLDGGISITKESSVWWRRPRKTKVDPAIKFHEAQRFAQAEWKASLHGLISTSSGKVINDPFCEYRAGNKVVQLHAARSVGLPTPCTVVTNEFSVVSDFHQANKRLGKRTIFKPLTPPMNLLGQARVIGEPEELRSGIRLAPIILQECIERGRDLRVIVAGGAVFGCTISFGGGFEDWRVDMDANFHRYNLKSHLKAKIVSLMELLGLESGSLDLRIGRDGIPYFLEVNPSGQFLFLELELDLPISESYATLLVGSGSVST